MICPEWWMSIPPKKQQHRIPLMTNMAKPSTTKLHLKHPKCHKMPLFLLSHTLGVFAPKQPDANHEAFIFRKKSLYEASIGHETEASSEQPGKPPQGNGKHISIFVLMERALETAFTRYIFGNSTPWASRLWCDIVFHQFLTFVALRVAGKRKDTGVSFTWWYPRNTPEWSFLVRKPMVVGYHHFRKPPNIVVYLRGSVDHQRFQVPKMEVSSPWYKLYGWYM